MKITIDQAFGIELIYNELRDKPIPIRTAYKFSKLMKIVESDLDFYRNKLSELLNTYALKDENGQFIINDDQTSVQIDPEKAKECQEKMEELQNIEIEISFNQPFAIEELDGLNLNLQQFQAFMPFIEE